MKTVKYECDLCHATIDVPPGSVWELKFSTKRCEGAVGFYGMNDKLQGHACEDCMKTHGFLEGKSDPIEPVTLESLVREICHEEMDS